MRWSRLCVGILLLSALGNCLFCGTVLDRPTCLTDSDCDEVAGHLCNGFDVVREPACREPPADGAPVYLSDPDHEACYFFYCTIDGAMECGGNSCGGSETCVADKENNGDVIAVVCIPRAKLEGAALCDGFDDVTHCATGKCVRDLEFKRNSLDDADQGYRCVPQ